MNKTLFITLTALVMISCALPSFGEYKISSDMDAPGLFVEYSDPGGLVDSYFRNGGLELVIHEDDTYFWVFPDSQTPQRIMLQMDAIFVSGDPETGAGFVCDYDYDTDQGIYFEITFDGYYVVYKNTADGWEYITDYVPTERINKSGSNKIVVICNAGEYEFYVNDQLLTKFEENVSLGDEIALFGYTYYNPGTVRIDNFAAEGLE